MKVQIERRFAIPAPPEATWRVLADIPTVASCMPGARITEKIDDAHYKGTVAVKLGPASLSFRGQIEVRECDAATRTLKLSAKGTDTTGASFATMDLTARIEADGDGASALVGASEAAVGGKAAAFGGRMMDAMSEQILKQFGANFTARVAAASESASTANAAAAPAAEVGPDAIERTTAASGGDAASVGPAPSGQPSTPPPRAPAAPAEAPQLNGLALLWAVFVDWLRGLFGKKKVN